MAVFTNQATLSYNGTSVNSNTVTGNLVEVLTVTKNAVRDSYSTGGNVTYVVSITNSGNTPFTGLTVTDNLGAYTFGAGTVTPLDYITDSVAYYQDGVLQADPVVADTDPLTITGITVPANGNTIIVYETNANDYAAPGTGGTVTNEVTVSGVGLANDVTADETVTVANEPVLSITKSLSPTEVTENSEVTYTFTILNSGNTAADVAENVRITDTFDPALTNITVALNGAAFPGANYTYNEATGEFATTVGSITVPAATYTQDTTTGVWTVTPGTVVVTVTGTI